MVFKIAIIGAGPAGCMLARLLYHSGQQYDITIFESENGIDFRSQGGTLDLHQHTGQAALKKAGLFEEFEKRVRYDGEALKFADKNFLCYLKTGASEKTSRTGRPEIDRPILREILFNSLPADTVQWSKKLVRVDESRRLHFADGTVHGGFDLIVGADGAWSKARPYLSQVRPFYSGIGGHAQQIPNAQKMEPALYQMVNRGSLFAFSNGKSIMAQYMGDGTIQVSTWRILPENWQTESAYDVHDPTEVKAALRQQYYDWDSRLVNFTQRSSDDVTVRNLYMLPIGHSWEHRHGVTIIGDAAHLMTPFAGEGVNLALEDCMKLAEAIISAAAAAQAATSTDADSQLDRKVAEFEQDMFARATKTQQLTQDMMDFMYFQPGTPRTVIERFVIRSIEDELGPVMTRIVTPLVYIWFFVFKLIW